MLNIMDKILESILIVLFGYLPFFYTTLVLGYIIGYSLFNF